MAAAALALSEDMAMSPRDQPSDVLGNLPRSRSHKRSPKRGARKPARKPAPARSQRTPEQQVSPRSVHGPPDPPSGAELVETMVQAAGEVAQIGLTLGVRALRDAVARIPRP